MGEHARFAPSSAPQWGNCSGSVVAQANYPDTESAQSREGTAAHWVMADTLIRARSMHCAGAEPARSCPDYLGYKAPNGVIIDDKIVDGAQVMVDDVLAVCDEYGGLERLLVEQRLYMPSIHPTDNWGTTDAALYLPQVGLLFCWDYKHGHRECRAEGNLQLADYLNGLCERFGINGQLQQHTRFVARVVQPFCYRAPAPVSHWTGWLTDLRPYWNRLAHKAEEAERGGTLTTGPWCRDCKAVGICSAARKAGYNFVDLVDEPYEMDDMDSHALAVERTILQDGIAVAKARLEAIEDELQHRITQGDRSSGLTVETNPGRLDWSVPPAQARALASQFGVDASKEAVLTPTQTIDAAPKEMRPLLKQAIKSVTDRAAGKLKLVPVTESRTQQAFKRND